MIFFVDKKRRKKRDSVLKAEMFMAMYEKDNKGLSVIEEDGKGTSEGRIDEESQNQSDYMSVMAHIKRVADVGRERAVSLTAAKLETCEDDDNQLFSNSEFVANLKRKRKGYFQEEKGEGENLKFKLEAVQENSKEDLLKGEDEEERVMNTKSIMSESSSESEAAKFCFREVTKDVMALNRIKLRRITPQISPDTVEALAIQSQNSPKKVYTFDKKIETDIKATKDQCFQVNLIEEKNQRRKR